MKKIFTLVASALLGATGLMAMPSLPAGINDLNYQFTPEAMQKMRTMDAKISIENEEGAYTRSWQDRNGNTWQFVLLKWEENLCDLLTFKGEDGKPFQYTFEELPFYTVQSEFIYTPRGGQSSTRYSNVLLAWPCMYYFANQKDENGEPDWSIVPLSTLANETRGIQVFEQTGYLVNINDDNYIQSWAVLPSPNIGIPSSYDGVEVFTMEGTSIDFTYYDVETSEIQSTLSATLKQCDAQGNPTGRAYSLICNYNGEADRILGFEPVTKNWKFGEIHLYNAGVTSSEILDEDNPFTETFGDVTAFYVAGAADGLIGPTQNTENGVQFDPMKVGFQALVENIPQNEFNYMLGYLFGDKKYGEDTTLDPSTDRFVVELGSYKQSATGKDYLAIAPKVNSFVQYQPGGESWSQEYGLEVIDGGYYYYPAHRSSVQFATNEGFHGQLLDTYAQTVVISSAAENIVYHYDPMDITKTRTFSATNEDIVADDAVEGVQAELNATVVARDGQIVINAAEAAPIAVYSLEGKLVKAAVAKNVAVEAAKGVYVVRVGNTAKKVVL